MRGVQIKIFYGYRFYDEEYDVHKTGYDYEIIDSSPEPCGFLSTVRYKLSSFIS